MGKSFVLTGHGSINTLLARLGLSDTTGRRMVVDDPGKFLVFSACGRVLVESEMIN